MKITFKFILYLSTIPGEDGWHPNLHLTTFDKADKSRKYPKKKCGHKSKISPSQFHRHRMMDRDDEKGDREFNQVIRGGRLFQEYCCGMHFLGEKMRLDWFKSNQENINAAAYGGLVDAQTNEDNLADVGVKIILPPTHIGSPRWYTERYQGN